MNILVIPISKLTKINPDLNDTFFTELINQIPQAGKIADNYYIINTNLTINQGINLQLYKIYNLLLHYARSKYSCIQILKNKPNE